MCPKSSKKDSLSFKIEDLSPRQRLLYEQVLRSARKAMKPFVCDSGPEAKAKAVEGIQKALKRLDESTPEFRRMVPAYEVKCDAQTGEVFCTFHMDVPYVEARVTLHRPDFPTWSKDSCLTEEEWNKLVDELVADLTPDPLEP